LLLRTGTPSEPRLSPESRYRRFFVAIAELSDQDLDYLTEVDHRDHEALAAIDEATGAIVGVARFVRTSADEAEPAIVVADDWQRRGVATRLLDALVERAREESIARFRAPVLAQNPAAVRVLSRLGPTAGAFSAAVAVAQDRRRNPLPRLHAAAPDRVAAATDSARPILASQLNRRWHRRI
jgi:RimJ/RimL family protein N-acetyltransferase